MTFNLKFYYKLILNKFRFIKTGILIILISFPFIQPISSQSNPDFSKDTLFYKSFDELYKNFNLVFPKIAKSTIYAQTYLTKAKQKNDSLKIAKGYYLFAQINFIDNKLKTIQYCDSVINFSKNIKNDKYPGLGYLSKGLCYFYLGQYKYALNNYLIAQNYATINNNTYQLFYINKQIAIMKLFWGNAEEAKIILLSQLKKIEKEKKYTDPDEFYSGLIFDLINAYLLTNKLDSADFYVQKGIQWSLKNNKLQSYYGFVSQSGITSYFEKKYQKSIDSLSKSFSAEKTTDVLFINYYYQGQSYCKLNNNEKAFYYLSKADSIYNVTNDVIPEVKDLQRYFVNYYKKRNDLKNQLKYLNRLLVADSIVDHNRKELSESIITNFDKPKLLAQKQEIENKLASNERKSFLKIIILIGMLVLISILLIVFYFQKRIYKKRFLALISSNNKIEAKEISTISIKSNGLAEEVIQEILTSLNRFEKSNDFINNNITLHTLAETLHTNSSYLSKVINQYKKQNFSNYLSQLRIDYCIKKLRQDETFRKFSIAAIANEIGFNNTESFSKAFYKRTKLYPSYFIKQLEKRNFANLN